MKAILIPKTTSKCIITRKVQLFIDIPKGNRDELYNAYQKLYDWQKIAFKASNIISTHLFCQEKIKDFEYFKDNIKTQLTDFNKNPEGIFNTSRQNTTYRLISSKYKNGIPSSIMACLNQNIYQNFVKERNDYFQGKKSLRSYKKELPVPFSYQSIYDLRFDEEKKEFTFLLFRDKKYSIPFRTYLGKDRSNNKAIIERCLTGDYQISISSYIINSDGKIYLLLAVQLPIKEHRTDPDIEVKAKLSFLAPVIVTFNNKEFLIGDKDSFIYKRVAIQKGIKRRMELMKFNRGGRGRKQKIHGIEEFKKKERNFINTYMHQISSMLVQFCTDNHAGKLILNNINEHIEEAIETPLVLRNWSYGDLIQKLKYKCKISNIELVLN